MIFVAPACGERDIVVTTSVCCMSVRALYIRCACVRPSGFFRAISSTYMNEFQNNLAQLLCLTSRSAIRNIYLSRLKVKVTFEDQIIKWSWI